jgi:hypothetical protein
MNQKLIQRYNQMGEELETVRRLAANSAPVETIQARLNRLEANQADLKALLLQLIDLSKPADKAWRSFWFEVDS